MNNITTTAYLVAMYRALETERPDALFQDPFARRLAGERGKIAVEVLGKKQQGVTAIAIRTRAIDTILDRLVTSGNVDTVLSLGAGLDTRPYRLNLPASLRWIEVDLPEILTEKEQKLECEQPACIVERVKLDLVDVRARTVLFDRINSSARQVLVLAEGLLPYLGETQVADLAIALHQQAHFKWWLFELASSFILQQSQKSEEQRLFDQYFGNGAPTFLFAPEQGTQFFRAYGWEIDEFRSLWEEAHRLKRPTWFTRLGSLPLRCFAKQFWHAITQQTGFVLLKRELCGSPLHNHH